MRTRASKKRIVSRTFEQGPFLSETDDEPAGCPTGSPLRTGSPTRGVRDSAPATACTLPRPPRPSADIGDGRRIRRPRLEGRGGASGTSKREGHPETEGFRGVKAFRRRGGPSTRVGLARYLRILEPPGRCDRDTTAPNPRSFGRLRCARVSREVRALATARGLFTSEKARPKESAQRGESSSFPGSQTRKSNWTPHANLPNPTREKKNLADPSPQGRPDFFPRGRPALSTPNSADRPCKSRVW